ncbi:MAG: hypothetical protein D6775_06470 [Caldilineae bacterium]|nr:MAG: hypothetical protein D6775_06470 [Caldilineae bacterium]
MDHIAILKDAARTTLRHRALWVLGPLWFLVGGGISTGYVGTPGNFGSNWRYNGRSPHLPRFDPDQFLAALVVLCGLGLILLVVSQIIRYVLQAGIYRSLYRLHTEGAEPTIAAGFREGWHRRTWRLVAQNWLVAVPFIIVALVLLALAAAPLLLNLTESKGLNVLGIVMAIGLFMGWLGFLLVVGMILSVLQQFWWRLAVIADQTTFTAMRNGWRLVRQNLGDIGIMWLLLVGINILVMVVSFPVILVLGGVTAAVAGGPGYLIYSLTHSLILSLFWAVPVSILFLVVPLLFLGGLYLIFQTEVWNRVFIEIYQRSFV